MGRSVIKKDQVRVVDAGAAGETGGSSPQPAARGPRGRHAKSVQLLKVGGAVRALEITCSCGEATVVELEYPGEEARP